AEASLNTSLPFVLPRSPLHTRLPIRLREQVPFILALITLAPPNILHLDIPIPSLAPNIPHSNLIPNHNSPIRPIPFTPTTPPNTCTPSLCIRIHNTVWFLSGSWRPSSEDRSVEVRNKVNWEVVYEDSEEEDEGRKEGGHPSFIYACSVQFRLVRGVGLFVRSFVLFAFCFALLMYLSSLRCLSPNPPKENVLEKNRGSETYWTVHCIFQ
ncbi:hypothetical protein BU24DRAFT_470496, partial [Aaosphaeria arxii CBS 175.79]